MAPVPFLHLGLPEVAIILLAAGGLGLPVGVPPQQDDQFLAKIAPEECLYYTSWNGMAKPDPKSTNGTERLLAEPEVQGLVREAESRLRAVLSRRTGARNDPNAALVAGILPDLGKLLLTHATAIYVSQIDAGPGGVTVNAALVVHLGEQAAETERTLLELQRTFSGGEGETRKIGGTEFRRLPLAPNLPPLEWGVRDKYLIVAAGEQTVEQLLARAQADPPKWLVDLRRRLPVERRATTTYANLKAMLEISKALAREPRLEAILQATGLANIGSYEATTGLDATGFMTRSAVRFEGPPQGLLSVWRGKSLALDDLKNIPGEATVALALRLDAKSLLDNVIESVGVVDPRAAREIQEGLDEIRSNSGLDLRNDLLQPLGDVWQLSTSPGEGGLLAGWTATVTVRDREQLIAALNRLIGFAQGAFAREPRAPRIKSLSCAGQTVYFLEVPEDDFPLAPSWCVTDKHLIVALFPQAIRARLTRGTDRPSLADRSDVAALFKADTKPTFICYQDTQPLVELFYPALYPLARMGTGELQRRGVDIDMSLLPSTAVLTRHLKPGMSAMYASSEGFEVVSQSTLPGGNVTAVAPLAIGWLVPAVGNARRAAGRAQSTNNLKMIGLSIHNFHDTYRGFPAAFSADKDGKPLLSWRVHVLPFLEQASLYNQFHLDEPWDSAHNKQLVAQMPSVFRSPASKAEAGKTVYLGLRHKDGVLAPPRDPSRGTRGPVGLSLADITDGTSNTFLVVEASDDRAVIWTKPDDLEVDLNDPLKGLVGQRPGGFLALLCDGSVRFLAANTSPETLKKLITRNGGEPIGDF